MVEKRVKNLRKVLIQYRKKLSEKIRVNQMILFGSYARGTPRDYSDVDLAVVSPDFKGDPIEDFLLLARVAREVTPLIEALPYTTAEFKKRERGGFLDEIVRTGKIVYRQ